MKYKKHSFEFKVKVVNEYLNGSGGYRVLGEKYNVDRSLVQKWVRQYNTYGYQGLTKSLSNTQYTSEFKQAVLKYREENQLSYRETAEYFGIKHFTTIANWNRKIQEGGPAALEGKQGRPIKYMSKKENNQKQVSKSEPLNETEREELERLREELRMKELENIILKKLNALPTDPTDKKRK
ncbi:helix-turn-helix domain-containing protein [Nosocomiicoccus ampullae]|uniref:Transposase n=2 Tax=Staphylococcaceae TaxID=90964 RepID=A0A9Q2CVS7_9STAP|nr:helix-turn-helix domain-containing protein [Nosocomiicoccus ampullae]MBB5175144.1 transposase [Nosocomiicoccus ampullae]QYA46475.1 helix-turn-helix domain-containing protein [Nosocomiicoccus ampullae]QYA46485.1 helix-turn-helix domain-containing protein [Nosocomiicoccus ampullae]QYA47258.1 helix-turn-helix domain-containing protein [Nosocomiicoccus ampullae]